MTLETNKQLVRDFYQAIDEKRFDDLGQYVSDDFVFYTQVDTPKPGLSGFIDSEKASFDAFEEVSFKLNEIVAEGDKVGAYLIFEGRNQLHGTGVIKPSGKNLRLSLFCLLTIRDGKITEKRAHFDVADAQAQLATN
ncbi:ester cyclase [Novosphingobium tardum]|uniref:Ester cyclase n=1 Tax=Novosphingobium tardum TaxID=1538021 RepID=A0ABV8RP66_9SPHN